MITVIETLYHPEPGGEPLVTEKKYSFSRNRFLKLFEERAPISGEELYELKKNNVLYFYADGFKRKIEIIDQSTLVLTSEPEARPDVELIF